MSMQERRFTITLAQVVWTWVGLCVVNLFGVASITGSYANGFAACMEQFIAVFALMGVSTVVEKIEADEA